jgi:uncharacterized membrane protein YraQ (UPF0718 family)
VVYFYLFTLICIIISLLKDKARTYKAFKVAWKKFMVIFPSFLTMLIFLSILLYLIPNKIILEYLGGADQIRGVFLALLFGSVTLMPGFVAFPLCGILLQKGVSYMVLAAFSTALMLVGVLTYPIEKAYFGRKVTIIRNIICLILSLLVALMIGLIYKELRL